MWYVKNKLGQVFFKSNYLINAQHFAIEYNNTQKIPFTKYYIRNFQPIFACLTYTHLCMESPFVSISIFGRTYRPNPFNKKYDKQHKKYIDKKFELLCNLAKKYHVWSYDRRGRKCNSLDF